MKKGLVALAAFVLALAFAVTSAAEDIPPDENLLVLACDHLRTVADIEGLTVKNCRRAEPEQVSGNRAVVKVVLATVELGKVPIDVYYHRSLWSVQTFTVTG